MTRKEEEVDVEHHQRNIQVSFVFYPPRNHLVGVVSLHLSHLFQDFIFNSIAKQSDRHRSLRIFVPSTPMKKASVGSLQRKKSVEFCAIIECLQFCLRCEKKSCSIATALRGEKSVSINRDDGRNHPKSSSRGCDWSLVGSATPPGSPSVVSLMIYDAG